MEKLIAHIKSNGSTQSVEEHFRNVSSLCGEFCESINFKYTGILLGYLHDMGKLRSSFTKYLFKSYEAQDNKNIKIPIKSDHSTIGAKFIYFYEIKNNPITKLYKELIAQIVMSHHTGLNNFIDINGNDYFLNRLNREFEYEEECINNFYKLIIKKDEFEELFYKGLREIEDFMENCREIYDISNLINFLFSSLIDADRIDAFNFQYNLKFKKKIANFSPYIKNVNEYILSFKNINIIDNLRSEISDICFNKGSLKKGIYELTLPVGSGKTLSSMRFALNHSSIYKKDRIIYVMPYISIIEQNADLIRKATKSDILEFHSNVIRDEGKIDSFEEYINSRKKKTYEDRWDNEIIFTSLVQFLNIFYSKPTKNNRRLNNLKNSVIVFDEVQSIPYYTRTLFLYAIGFLEKYLNTTILLMTATQPNFNRELKSLKYKESVALIENQDMYFEKFKRAKVVDKREKAISTTGEIGNLIEEEIKDVSSILFIVNTKNTVDFVKNSISSDEYEVITLSTNFCPEHRSKIIKNAKDILNNIRNKRRKRKLIMITTQLIEAGVDISFEKVIRSLSSLTSIAQASGRCNRNKERDIGEVVVIDINNNIEKINNLEEIYRGKKITNSIFIYNKNKDFNYLSKEAVEEYFKYEKQEISKREFDFIFEKTTLSDLFSCNSEGVKRSQDVDLFLTAAFKDVKENFYVIKEDTVSVIVSYNEGKNLIEKLNSEEKINNLNKLLQKAQRFSISIFEDRFNELLNKGVIHELNTKGVYALVSTYYGENGLDLEGENLEDFIF